MDNGAFMHVSFPDRNTNTAPDFLLATAPKEVSSWL
jgi:hypothetical protein